MAARISGGGRQKPATNGIWRSASSAADGSVAAKTSGGKLGSAERRRHGVSNNRARHGMRVNRAAPATALGSIHMAFSALRKKFSAWRLLMAGGREKSA